MKTIPTDWMVRAGNGAKPVVRVRISPTGVSNFATTGHEFYSGDYLDPLWTTTRPHLGVVKTGDITESVDILTRKSSVGGWNFTVAHSAWVPLANTYRLKGVSISCAVGFAGSASFVDVWKGRITDYRTDTVNTYVKCKAPVDVFKKAAPFDMYFRPPAHPLYWLEEIFSEYLDPSEYDASSLDWRVNYPDIRHFIIGRSPIQMEYANRGGLSGASVDVEGTYTGGLQLRAVDKEVDHICELVLGSVVLRSGVLTFHRYTAAPATVGILSTADTQFDHKSSLQNIYNVIEFEYCRGENINASSVEKGGGYLGIERIDSSSVFAEALALPTFKSEWVNGCGFIIGGLAKTASNQYTLADRIDFYPMVSNDVVRFASGPHQVYGPMLPSTWWMDPMYMSGVSGVGFQKTPPGATAPARLGPACLSVADNRVAYLRVFEVNSTSRVVTNTSEVISIDIWSGDPTDVAMLGNFKDSAGNSFENGYTVSVPTPTLYSNGERIRSSHWARLKNRGELGTTPLTPTTAFTAETFFLDATLPIWWTKAQTERLVDGIPIMTAVSGLNTLRFEMLDPVNIDTPMFLTVNRDGTDVNDVWEIVKQSFNPLEGKIKRTLGMLTANKFPKPGGYLESPKAEFGTYAHGMGTRSLTYSKEIRISQETNTDAGTIDAIDALTYYDFRGAVEVDVTIYDNVTKTNMSTHKLRAQVTLDSSANIAVNTSAANQVIHEDFSGYASQPALEIVASGANLQLSFSGLGSTTSLWNGLIKWRVFPIS